ncbi:hypothetical protein F5146DRAFT_1058984 [Armillaria mellea]|nr:hypothetical protein F5146DRAFT_1058984 [Armillaria mellea]
MFSATTVRSSSRSCDGRPKSRLKSLTRVPPTSLDSTCSRWEGGRGISVRCAARGETRGNRCLDFYLRWGSVELDLVPSFLPRLSSVRRRVDQVENVYLRCLPNDMEGTVAAFQFALMSKTLDLFGVHDIAGIAFPKENLVVFSDGTPIPAPDAVPKVPQNHCIGT